MATASNGGGSISLESAIRTCKVDTGWANKVESDRFLNPDNMVCPIWNGMDTAGRRVCPDSFWTKRAGCNSAEDRVMVENSVSRPQYMEYVNLNAAGVAGQIYGNTMPWRNSVNRNKALQNDLNYTGQFGNGGGFGGEIYPACGVYPYNEAMAQEHAAQRQAQAANEGYRAFSNKRAAGF